ncbi:mitochondrial glyco protein [Venturia nashicola]|nr:mitochondrial glyco protein [Venturia nashicola]
MLSLRSFARAAPRSISRLPSQSRFVSRTTIFTPRIQPSMQRWTALFSTTPARKEGNEELVAKLKSEYDIETSDFDEAFDNETVKAFIKDSPFEIQDTPGIEEVVLTRKYNDETIRVSFTIADLTNDPHDPENNQDLYQDEEEDFPLESEQSGGANTKGSVNQDRTPGGNTRVAPQDSASPAELPELDDEADHFNEESAGYHTQVNVKITRDGRKGAMLIEALAQDGEFLIDNVYFFADANLAEPSQAEQEWKRKNVYAGPPFGNLDEDLQVLLEKYLGDRGINSQLATFVPEYIDQKEQKEYVNWLKNLKGFLEE